MINAPLPHPESRITLTDERDRLGLRRLHLHWHLPDAAFDAPIGLFQDWMREVSSRGLGRIRWQRRRAPTADQRVGVGYHHMGTTRMSASPDHGVVDPNGRAWDRENLFVAGSSQFPAAGYANPTLTIVALAARQARHIHERLESHT
jgi:choline dehydrogenase-like flavoprotein